MCLVNNVCLQLRRGRKDKTYFMLYLYMINDNKISERFIQPDLWMCNLMIFEAYISHGGTIYSRMLQINSKLCSSKRAEYWGRIWIWFAIIHSYETVLFCSKIFRNDFSLLEHILYARKTLGMLLTIFWKTYHYNFLFHILYTLMSPTSL